MWGDDLLDDLLEEIDAIEEAEVTSTSTSWHRDRWRTTAPASRVAVLDALMGAMPGGLTRAQVVAECGNAATSRIGELRADGWDIETTEAQNGTALYRLMSTVQGHPVVGRVSALRVYRMYDGSIEVVPMTPRSQDRSTWDDAQAEADRGAVERALRGRDC